jgi:hypothetical protein
LGADRRHRQRGACYPRDPLAEGFARSNSSGGAARASRPAATRVRIPKGMVGLYVPSKSAESFAGRRNRLRGRVFRRAAVPVAALDGCASRSRPPMRARPGGSWRSAEGAAHRRRRSRRWNRGWPMCARKDERLMFPGGENLSRSARSIKCMSRISRLRSPVSTLGTSFAV